MRTSSFLLPIPASTLAPIGCRKITETFRSGRDFVEGLPVTIYSSSAEAPTEVLSGCSPFMYCSSSSFPSAAHRSSFLSFLVSQHSASSSQILGFQKPANPVQRSLTRWQSAVHHRQHRKSLHSGDVHPLRRVLIPSNFCSGRKVRRFFSSGHPSGVSAAAPIYSTTVSRNPPPSLSTSAVENEAPEYSALSAPSSAYVHLPFCRRRCFYCDFPILAVGERTEKTEGHIDSTMSRYVDLVCKEIATSARRFPTGAPITLKTVFFGGGTPSLLPVPLLTRIIQELKGHFQVANDAEISMEMDPGTFDRDKLAGFLESGITRVSLGIQSFQEELLQACGRAHGLQEVYDAVEAIHSNGLKNWSLDLMASLPNQTLQQWEHSLNEAVSLSPAHVSVYDLQIEEGTIFHRQFKAGQKPLPSDEQSAELYCIASKRLREEGFEHYEVSNYAKPGFHCKHNLVYWENRPYYAFGLGSTSYVDGQRFSRPRKMKEYATYVQNLEASGSATYHNPQFSLEDQVLDTVMLSLRLARGLNLTEFETRFGSSLTSTVCNGLVPFVEKGLVEAVDAQRQTISSSKYIKNWKDGKVEVGEFFRTVDTNDSTGRDLSLPCIEENPRVPNIETSNLHGGASDGRAAFVRLTDPAGFLLSNEVISSIFAALPCGGV